MPIRITIPKSVLAAGNPLPTGWQQFTIGKPYTKASKDGMSMNYWVPLVFDNDASGREIEHLFNSKGIEKGFMNPFIAAITNKTLQEISEGLETGTLEFDLEALEGTKILGKVYHTEFEGRIQSKIENFANPAKVPF